MAPVVSTVESESIARKYGFDLLYSAKIDDSVPVKKFRSQHTGLTVCVADVEGPLVHGYFCLATEAHDDDGLPHTLEHLIFLGSELYPYKGVLDLLANRCLASGTNAWTDTDHTCYTLKNAGSEGFLNLMPIYVDHILYPTLTDAGFITEVHHVNEAGEDGGVVYCEMQGRENMGESLTHLAMLRAMYPGRCGYKSETGGIMKNLRESTNVDKVRAYHRTYYRPENLCLVIAGKVNEEDVFQALKPVEGRILAKGERPQFVRPWQELVPELKNSVDLDVPYPSDDEDNGMVYVAWRAAKASDLNEYHTLLVLLEYMTDTAVAPLQQAFVEIDDPYCSTVKCSYIENSEACMYLAFENVPTAKLQEIKPRLFEYLNKMVEGSVQLDIDRMRTVINRKILNILSGIESSPHEMVAMHLIGDFLYGSTEDNLQERLNPVAALRKLVDEPISYWLVALRQAFINTNSVTTVGTPSKQLMESMSEKENARVVKQRETLGEQGLQEKARLLNEANKTNEIPPPDSLLSSTPMPSTSSIAFLDINRSSNHCPKTPDCNSQFPLSALPLKFQLDDINSNFVQIYAVLDTSHIPANLRLYLPLYVEVILESPIFHNTVDGISTHETVIKQLSEDTVSISTSVGISEGTSRFSTGPYAQAIVLFLKVEIQKYPKSVQWVYDLLNKVQFVEERIHIIANKMLNDVAQQKRRGNKITETIIHDICFLRDSNKQISSMLRQHNFLTSVVAQLHEAPEKVCKDMEELRSLLTRESNITIHLATNVQKLVSYGDPQQPWFKNFGTVPLNMECSSSGCVPCSGLVNTNAAGQGVIAGIGAVESSFMVQCIPSLTNYTHDDYPAILVFLQYITQLEGPMWKQVRGLGLAYGYNMPLRVSEGLLYLTLYRSTHIVAAFKEARNILESYISGQEKLEPLMLESARSSLIFELIEKEKSVADIALQSLMLYYRGVGQDFTKTLLKRVAEVSMQDLVRVGPQYVSQLFDPSKSWAAVCCHPSKVDDIVAGFGELSKEFVSIKSIEDSYLSKIYVT